MLALLRLRGGLDEAEMAELENAMAAEAFADAKNTTLLMFHLVCMHPLQAANLQMLKVQAKAVLAVKAKEQKAAASA